MSFAKEICDYNEKARKKLVIYEEIKAKDPENPLLDELWAEIDALLDEARDFMLEMYYST